jgi:hypothetical protein
MENANLFLESSPENSKRIVARGGTVIRRGRWLLLAVIVWGFTRCSCCHCRHFLSKVCDPGLFGTAQT